MPIKILMCILHAYFINSTIAIGVTHKLITYRMGFIKQFESLADVRPFKLQRSERLNFVFFTFFYYENGTLVPPTLQKEIISICCLFSISFFLAMVQLNITHLKFKLYRGTDWKAMIDFPCHLFALYITRIRNILTLNVFNARYVKVSE